jgi:hypothetical protein
MNANAANASKNTSSSALTKVSLKRVTVFLATSPSASASSVTAPVTVLTKQPPKGNPWMKEPQLHPILKHDYDCTTEMPTSAGTSANASTNASASVGTSASTTTSATKISFQS